MWSIFYTSVNLQDSTSKMSYFLFFEHELAVRTHAVCVRVHVRGVCCVNFSDKNYMCVRDKTVTVLSTAGLYSHRNEFNFNLICNLLTRRKCPNMH